MKTILILITFTILLLASGCGTQSSRIAGRWEMDENAPGIPSFEFLKDGTGISNPRRGDAVDFTYKIKGNELTISYTKKTSHVYQVEFQAEDMVRLWRMNNKGEVYEDRVFYRKQFVEMPLEQKLVVAQKIYRAYTILDARQSMEESDTWLLAIQVDSDSESRPYRIWKDASDSEWNFSEIFSEEELAAAQSTSVSKTRVANYEATTDAMSRTLVASRPTSIPRLADQDLTGLIDEASNLCRKSFADDDRPASPASAPSPAVVIKDTDRTSSDTYTAGEDFLQQARTVSEIRTLVCIRTDRQKTGDYSGGRSGYRLIQYIHIISWPKGELLASETIEGGGPGGPFVLSSAGPGEPIYGKEPAQEVMDYVLSVID